MGRQVAQIHDCQMALCNESIAQGSRLEELSEKVDSSTELLTEIRNHIVSDYGSKTAKRHKQHHFIQGSILEHTQEVHVYVILPKRLFFPLTLYCTRTMLRTAAL